MLAPGFRVPPDLAPGSAAVVVVGRDAIVGQALELLLRSSDFDVEFSAESSFGVPESLSGARLLILAPGLDPASRGAILASVRSGSATSRLPVLELVADTRGPQSEELHFLVPWPCRPEDLRRQMEVAMNGSNQEVGREWDGDGIRYIVQGKREGP